MKRPDLKIHVAGPLVGDTQRCTRCHARIDSNRRWPGREPAGWKHGALIAWRRNGASVVTAEQAAAVRNCGRAS
jgi:hypothetical protein